MVFIFKILYSAHCLQWRKMLYNQKSLQLAKKELNKNNKTANRKPVLAGSVAELLSKEEEMRRNKHCGNRY